ncbi:MAG: MarR family transcriptional regulator [Candidatus Nanopelagicales bacterium]
MPANLGTDAPDLRIAVMRLARRLRRERTSDALTPSQMAVLATLLREGPMSPGELAEVERVQPPSMTRILHSLRTAGLVLRAAHPTDGRQVIYTATDTARSMVERDRKRRDQWLLHRLEVLQPSEIATLEQAIPILNRLALD